MGEREAAATQREAGHQDRAGTGGPAAGGREAVKPGGPDTAETVEEDIVTEADLESFPASDAPSWWAGRD